MAKREAEYQYWGDRAQTFDQDSAYIVGKGLNDDITGWLRMQFAPPDAVLELGCGTGAFSDAVAPLVDHLVAADMSERMLHEARAKLGRHGNVRLEREDAYTTSFADSEFDAVMMVNLLHIVDDPARVLHECNRVLRDGGKVVVVDVTSQGTPLLAWLLLGLRYLRRWRRPPSFGRNLGLDDLTELARGAGFRVKDGALVGETIKAACMTAFKPA